MIPINRKENGISLPLADARGSVTPSESALLFAACIALCVLATGCSSEKVKADPAAEAPPAAQVVPAGNSSMVNVDHPEQYPVVTAGKYDAAPELNVTGTVTPDVSRNIPVISIASGRVLEIDAKLGDTVTKGQLLLKVQSADISGAFSDYRQAIADQTLAKAQLERSKILLDKGAIAQKDYEVTVDTENKANVTVETTIEHLRVLGADKDHPSAIIDVTAPVSGVITDQQVTQASGVQGLASPNPFTISDLSHVWVICDVYENDLKNVQMGQFADVKLNAYPDRTFRARISNIGTILDPNLRTAKVRLEVENTGLMRIGMFVTATFHGSERKVSALVPASAILHLHDRDWVYVPAGGKSFRRVEVSGGITLPDNTQVVTGINPGDQVVRDALVLENSVEQ
jgi:cobalt-zinc-cadmium efflux system membrane fusion protein